MTDMICLGLFVGFGCYSIYHFLGVGIGYFFKLAGYRS